MGFEINDEKELVPPEEDIYGVEDLLEQEEFNSLLGMKDFSQEARMRRRKNVIIAVAVLILLSFTVPLISSLINMFRR